MSGTLALFDAKGDLPVSLRESVVLEGDAAEMLGAETATEPQPLLPRVTDFRIVSTGDSGLENGCPLPRIPRASLPKLSPTPPTPLASAHSSSAHNPRVPQIRRCQLHASPRLQHLGRHSGDGLSPMRRLRWQREYQPLLPQLARLQRGARLRLQRRLA